MITKEETAQKIADLHYRVEGGMQNIFRIRRKDIRARTLSFRTGEVAGSQR